MIFLVCFPGYLIKSLLGESERLSGIADSVFVGYKVGFDVIIRFHGHVFNLQPFVNERTYRGIYHSKYRNAEE